MPLLLMTGLLVMLFIFMIRRMGGAGSPMAFGRSRGKLFAQEDIEITFEDVAGIEEAVDELREVVEFLKTPEKYQMLGGRIPKGVLLVGPPGTGKTLLAKAVAGEAGVPFFSLSGSDFVEMFVGVGAARVRDMFQQAEQKAPCIIFIDELDALGKTRGSGNIGGHDEREQTLNALLVEMDGFNSNSGVIVMAATNRPETLDAALLRPGRFDRHVLVDRPDVAGREEIIEVHLENIKVDSDVDVKALAAITSGFVGADLANMVNEAALLAARKGRKMVTMADFNEAVERSSAGLEKKSRIMQDDEKLRVAYHEAGHALVASSLPNTDPVHKVSIIPRGLAALGYTHAAARAGSLPHDPKRAGKPNPSRSWRHRRRGNDLQRHLHRRPERPGAGDRNRPQHGHGLRHEPAGPRSTSATRIATRSSSQRLESPRSQYHSEQTAREIDQEVKRILDEALQRTRHILESRRAALEAISHHLMKQEVIDAIELKRLIEENSPSPMIVPGTDMDGKRRASAAPSKPARTSTPRKWNKPRASNFAFAEIVVGASVLPGNQNGAIASLIPGLSTCDCSHFFLSTTRDANPSHHANRRWTADANRSTFWPGAPVVTAMAIIALGATETTLARFRGNGAFLPVVVLHSTIYASLYALFVGATLNSMNAHSAFNVASMEHIRSGRQRASHGCLDRRIFGCLRQSFLSRH